MKSATRETVRELKQPNRAIQRREGWVLARAALGIKTILVPVDFSEFSRRALAYAAGFAQSVGAKLILLHVVESFPIDRFISQETLENDNQARLEGAKNELKTLKGAFAGAALPKIQQFVRLGKPYQAILETSKETGADVIVLGSHGYTGIQRVYLGSTAERVVRHAPCHVLVVRE